jgi:hypothetical protein
VSLHTRAWRLLAGDDQPDRPGLPIAELLAPLPLLLLAILFVNDWVLKPTALPRWLTGKLSDFAGLAVFPLVATAAFDLLLAGLARLGARVDFTLRRWKLAVAIALTGGVFAAMKLVPEIARWVAAALGVITASSARVMPDPTDLVALPALAFAWWFGRRAIARGAYGRLAWARRARPASPFGDAAACGADREDVDRLDRAVTAWIDGGPSEPVRAGLAALRR